MFYLFLVTARGKPRKIPVKRSAACGYIIETETARNGEYVISGLQKTRFSQTSIYVLAKGEENF